MIKKIALSSVLMALVVVSLFVGSIWPVKIAMSLAASLVISVVVIECGHKFAWLVYFGCSFISFLIIPKKMLVYGFILFLGYYPIIKLYIERPGKLILEWVIKLLCFNIILAVSFFAAKIFLLPSLDASLVGFVFKYIAAIIAISEVFFVVYDLGISFFISYYQKKLRGFIKL